MTVSFTKEIMCFVMALTYMVLSELFDQSVLVSDDWVQQLTILPLLNQPS